MTEAFNLIEQIFDKKNELSAFVSNQAKKVAELYLEKHDNDLTQHDFKDVDETDLIVSVKYGFTEIHEYNQVKEIIFDKDKKCIDTIICLNDYGSEIDCNIEEFSIDDITTILCLIAGKI